MDAEHFTLEKFLLTAGFTRDKARGEELIGEMLSTFSTTIIGRLTETPRPTWTLLWTMLTVLGR